MTNLETFILDSQDKIFRLYKYKKVYTPYEKEQKYTDESEFENGGYADYVYIRQGIELPDGDVLLQLEKTNPKSEDYITDDEMKYKVFRYEKLSDISLQEFEKDMIK